ncbi:MAG: YihY/virulence factor BrkB family protein [Steroidobacteraceae bacterium]
MTDMAEAPIVIETLRSSADILRQTWKDIGRKDLSLVAAGVTYYLLVALFPALAALISVYGLVENPAGMTRDVQSLSSLLSPSIVRLASATLHELISASSRSLGLGAIIGIGIALFSGMQGMTGMMTALNIAYGQTETRGYVRFYATALFLTVLIIASGLITLMLFSGLPALLSGTAVPSPTRWISLVIEWPLLIVFVVGVVSVIYRYGPAGSKPQRKWASLGIITATILWLIGSILFSVYVHNFGRYSEVYGSLGLPLMILTWVWFSVFVVLFGAEINGAVQRQMRGDRIVQ